MPFSFNNPSDTEANDERLQEIERLREALAASQAGEAEAWRLLEAARQELILDLDRKDAYYKAVQRRTHQLIGQIDPLMLNLSAFRLSKTYKIGILAGALRNLPLGGKLALLGRMVSRAIGRRGVQVNCPENEIMLTIVQLAEQMQCDLKAMLDMRITRPVLPTPPPRLAPRPPVDPAAVGAAQVACPWRPGSVLARQPLVSVMLPVFNHADMLGGAVESVRAQTYANWEIVILDDGSTDNIDAVLERFQDDPRIRIYRQQNQKLPNALTHLHQLARGEFFTWTSADNLMAPAMLERLVAAIAEDPETVLVYADTALIDERGEPLAGEGYRDHNRDTANPALMRLPRHVEALGEEPDNYINACFLYRAEAARAVGPYAPDLNALEDYDFFLRLRRAGRCRHLENAEPLYFYRVHRRTMSEEALTKSRERHIRNGQLLIEYDQARGRWFRQRWDVVLSPALPEARRRRLRELLEAMPVNLLADPPAGGGTREETLKLVRFLAPGEPLGGDGAAIVCEADGYRLLHVKDGAAREIGRVPLGREISWLAAKSRGQVNQPVYYQFYNAQGRPIVGTHLSFAEVDVERTIALLNAHPDLYFALIDDEAHGGPARGQAIAAACANAAYLGPAKFGLSYWGYADFAAVFCPPLEEGASGRALAQARQLALATGRWLLYPAQAPLDEAAPFAIPYAPGDPLPQAWLCDSPRDRAEVLDRYLRHGSEAGSLDRALRLLGAALQEAFIPRPDFGQFAPPKDAPRPWRASESGRLSEGWIGLWIDTLDRGGLEEILALLAGELRERGIQIRILCGERGGLIADRLRAQGFPCEEFALDAARFEAYLRRDPPLLLSTHYTQQMSEVPARLGIPVVETIHNMYVHFDAPMWERERRRSAGFAHAIAVSSLVRDYYLHGHGAMAPERVSVVNNAADYHRTLGVERRAARQLLGVGGQTCVYLNLASLDGRKNQLGLLTAFERLQSARPDSLLVMMGNIASPFYHEALIRQIEHSGCGPAVRFMDFQQDMSAVLAAADVFVLPSYFEGWSVSATEAAYAGLPVIHTHCGSGLELCRDGGGYLVDNPGGDPLRLDAQQLYRDCMNPEPPNTALLVNAMSRAHDELAHWQEMRHQLRSRSIARFSVRKMVDGYLEIFRRIVEAS